MRSDDKQSVVTKINVPYPFMHIFPMRESLLYIKNNARAVRGTNYLPLVILVTALRAPQAMFISAFYFTSNLIKKAVHHA